MHLRHHPLAHARVLPQHLPRGRVQLVHHRALAAEELRGALAEGSENLFIVVVVVLCVGRGFGRLIVPGVQGDFDFPLPSWWSYGEVCM